MKVIDVKMYVPIVSKYTNKSIKFKAESVRELEAKLLEFFVNSDLKDMVDPDTGRIRNVYSFLYRERVYRDILDVELEEDGQLTIFAHVIGG